MALDHRRRRELVLIHHLLGVALALEAHLKAAQVVEHHHLTLGECLDDVVLHALEHRIAVRLRDGGRVVDASCELLHRELTGLDCLPVEEVHIRILGVSYFFYCVSDSHSC